MLSGICRNQPVGSRKCRMHFRTPQAPSRSEGEAQDAPNQIQSTRSRHTPKDQFAPIQALSIGTAGESGSRKRGTRFRTPTNRQDSRFGSRSDPKGEAQDAPSLRARRAAGSMPAVKSSRLGPDTPLKINSHRPRSHRLAPQANWDTPNQIQSRVDRFHTYIRRRLPLPIGSIAGPGRKPHKKNRHPLGQRFLFL
jgi:hypothetical protein